MNKFLVSFFIMVSFTAVASAAQLINGAGATFPYPLYSKWFSEYNKQNPNVKINYQSVGSGAGIKQLLAKTVDFGASDAPMKDDELKSAGAPVVHIPTVLGAVVVSYNIPGVSTSINLSPTLVSDIFMGKIKKWNDPKIAAENAGVKFPDTAVTPVYRSDGSGTTSVFTDYLAKVSPEWSEKVGAGKAVKWPTGLGGKGNEGVAGVLKQTPGSVGYVEQVYAVTNKLPVASIKNAAGKYVQPSFESVSAAAEGALKTMPADYRVSITNAAGATSYPIAAFTYILVYKKMNATTGKDFVQFLKWSMGQGQSFAKDLAYAPLPKSLVTKVEATISQLEF
ncbi:MAG: phosphate ABC transporter substrate-binding protein PstS [Bdellovibrionota bacterium]